MKQFAAANFLFTFTLALAPVWAAESVTFDELEKHEMQYPLAQTCQTDPGKIDEFEKNVLSSLDPRCLSDSKCIVNYSVFFSASGIPAIKKDSGVNDTKADDFYCEQAIWENIACPGFAPGRRFVFRFYGGSNNQFGEHPELLKARSAGKVSLHLIPHSFPMSDLVLNLGTVTDPRFVARLSVSKVNDSRLLEFRKEWFDIVKPPVTNEKIVSTARMLRKKYADLFS